MEQTPMPQNGKPRKPLNGDVILKELIPFLIALLVLAISENIPHQQAGYERFFATTLNKWTISLLSLGTGWLKLSLGEMIVYAHAVAVPIVALILLVKLFKGGFFKSVLRLSQYICVLYILFMTLWGFNYHRQSIAVTMGFEVRPYAKEELYALTESLIKQANALRVHQMEDDQGVMTITGTYKEIFARAYKGYDVLGEQVKSLSGLYGKPKPVLASEAMLYTGITGVYFPFTAEANVNVLIPDLLLPATTLHEMAHQRGIAPEDEANFIAYLAAMAHPDRDFKYSGTVMALIYSMNALYRQDADLAMTLRDTYSEGLSRDIISYSRFWDAYEGQATETADRVNDTYLKANRQEEGVRSYGLMVDLLIGYYIHEQTP